MLANLTIRHVTRRDLPALEWEGEYAHYRVMFQDAFQRHQRGESILWVVEELAGGSLLGQAFVQLVGTRAELADGRERAYIYAIRVRPAYRGLGIGTHLIQTIEKDLVWRGYRYATLNVNKDNLDARQLYERLGYQIVGYEPGCWSYTDHLGYRRHVNEPAWRMEKHLH